ncbi:response regulator transcription factor [Burkholderiaceae bacterium DAT-1]|nr:response regulator transcription factor [Burkholderiaceae bacterium DAT-1]
MRIIIADDHALFRQGLKMLLSQKPDWQIVAEVGDASTLKQTVQQHDVNMVLMDYQMPGEDSAAVLAWLKKRYPALRVMVVTGIQSGAVLQHLVDAGADGVMLKESEADELLTGISRVAAGHQHICPTARERLRSARVELTAREFQILQAIATGQSSVEIAERLQISSRTVDKHRENLMAKFHVNNAMLLVQAARELQLLA